MTHSNIRTFHNGAIRKALAAALLLVGCATNRSNMQSWLGQSESKLVSSWGAPSTSIDTRDGGRVLTWQSPYGQYGQRVCRQSFTVSSAGMIVAYSLQGCPP